MNALARACSLKGGAGNLGQRNQLADEPVLVGLDERHGLLELRAVDEAADRARRAPARPPATPPPAAEEDH